MTPLTSRVTLARALLAASAAVVLATAPASAVPPPIDFADTVFLPTGQTGQASLDGNGTAVADLDGDGHQDVALIAPWMGTTVVIMYGDGSGGFSAPKTLTAGSINNDVIIGDYNDDDRPDLAITGLDSFVVLLNDGGHGYHQSQSYPLWQNPFQATGLTQDFDANGDLDLALKTVAGIRMMLGNGDGTFRSGPLTSIAGFPGEIASIDVADLDGDSTVDLVAGLGGSQQVVALKGNGVGGFTEVSSVFVPFVPTTVKAGDLDHNGTDDVVVLPEASPPGATAAVVLNGGSGDLGSPAYYNGGFGNPNGTIEDLNGDGNLDVVSVNTFNGDLVILAGVGNGTLSPAGTFATASSAQTPVTADFDEDGLPDIAVPSSCPGSSNTVCLSVLVNQS